MTPGAVIAPCTSCLCHHRCHESGNPGVKSHIQTASEGMGAEGVRRQTVNETPTAFPDVGLAPFLGILSLNFAASPPGCQKSESTPQTPSPKPQPWEGELLSSRAELSSAWVPGSHPWGGLDGGQPRSGNYREVQGVQVAPRPPPPCGQ